MNAESKPAQGRRMALYARVSTDKQAQEGTIASQVALLQQRIAADGGVLDEASSFIDDGVSGTSLVRPALERLRDQAAAGAIERLYVLTPDRLEAAEFEPRIRQLKSACANWRTSPVNWPSRSTRRPSCV